MTKYAISERLYEYVKDLEKTRFSKASPMADQRQHKKVKLTDKINKIWPKSAKTLKRKLIAVFENFCIANSVNYEDLIPLIQNRYHGVKNKSRNSVDRATV